MEGFNEWLTTLANVTQIATDIMHLLRGITPNPDPEKQAYRQRVKTRRRNQEARPEWDAIGRCVWYLDPNVPDDIQMEYVPKVVQDTFSGILHGRAAHGLSMEFSQITSDQTHTYLMETGRFPGGCCVLFWAKPN